MPPSRRRISTPGKELIIPLALGITAAIASVGLYLWSDTEAGYYSGSSDDEREKESKQRRLKTRRQPIEHDRITEEETDDLDEEDRRRDARFRSRSKGKQSSTMAPGGLQQERTESKVASVAGKAKDAVLDILPGVRRERAVEELKREAAMNQQQYAPPSVKKKSVAIVVSERKAMEGHDSDSDIEEVGLPFVRYRFPTRLIYSRFYVY